MFVVALASATVVAFASDCNIGYQTCGHWQDEGRKWNGTSLHTTKLGSSCDCPRFCCEDANANNDISGWNFGYNYVCQCFGAGARVIDAINNPEEFRIHGECEATFDWCPRLPQVPNATQLLPCANQTQTDLCVPADLPLEYARLTTRGSFKYCSSHVYHTCANDNGTIDAWGVPCESAPSDGTPSCSGPESDQDEDRFGVCVLDDESLTSWAIFGNENVTEFVRVFYADRDCKVLQAPSFRRFTSLIEPLYGANSCQMWKSTHEERPASKSISSCAEVTEDEVDKEVRITRQYWVVDIPEQMSHPQCMDANPTWECSMWVDLGMCPLSGNHCLKSCGCCNDASNCSFGNNQNVEDVASSLGLHVFAAALKFVKPKWRGTVLAPTDHAFQALMGPNPINCMTDATKSYWTDLVQRHISEALVTSPMMRGWPSDEDSYDFVIDSVVYNDSWRHQEWLHAHKNGSSLQLTRLDHPTLTRKILIADVAASHATLHVIDGVFVDWIPELCKVTSISV